MDISITKKKRFNFKRLTLISIVILLSLAAAQYLWFLGQADLSINRKSLVFAEVKKGKFTVSVHGTGLLVPSDIQWLSANAEAKVDRVVVKAGNFVKKGDLIVSLSNPKLIQQLEEAQWELEAKQAELKAEEVAQEEKLLEQKVAVLKTKLDYESSLLKYDAQTEVLKMSTGTVSELSYQKTRLETDQFKQRWIINKSRLVKMRENLSAQNSARKAQFNKAKKIVERLQDQVENLQVKAIKNSIVLEMPLEAGQTINMGSNIAKLAKHNEYVAELQVPEIQINQVATGQQVIIDTRNNKVNGVVSRVDPAVINGNVQVDVVFSEALPNDARPELSVDGEIIINEISDTLFVDRPLFSQRQHHSMFYKLTADNRFAERIEVAVGSGSISQIQIVSGLKRGDKIIISDPTRFETYEKIRIN